MARVKRGVTARQRHNKVLALAKGYKHGRKSIFRLAKQAILKAGQFSYRDRRVKKRDFRSQWIVTLSAAAHQHGMTYSQFMASLKRAEITLNRKVLAELAQNHPEEFAGIIERVKSPAA